jgi:hypothetical protein
LSVHAAHQRGYLGPDPEFAAGTGFDKPDTLDAADLGGFGPFSPSHVHLGVVYPERLDLDDDVTRFRFGVRDLPDHQVFRAAKFFSEDGTHE